MANRNGIESTKLANLRNPNIKFKIHEMTRNRIRNSSIEITSLPIIFNSRKKFDRRSVIYKIMLTVF